MFPVALPDAVAGFARNGSANVALRAMAMRVRSGAGRGKIVMKGDSTTVGQGAGTNADTYRLTGARANRPAAVLAARLTAANLPALDGAIVADHGLGTFATVPLPAYDPRIALGTPAWTFASTRAFAGGALMQNSAGGVASFMPSGIVDTFVLDYYRAQAALLEFAVDGGTSEIPGGPVNVSTDAGGGFGRATIATATRGRRVFQFACQGAAGSVAVASVRGYDSTVPAIDIMVDAALGATATDQGASGDGWQNLDHLLWEAPDLTIVNLGLYDMAMGLPAATYAANLKRIVSAGLQSGDVLLVFPYPVAPSFVPIATQAAYRDVAAAVAKEAGIAFLSLFDYFGGAFTPAIGAQLADGLVHGDAGLYAEVGAAYALCLLAMAA